MSDEDFFAPPPFKAADALASLKRGLRDLKLSEREGAFEQRGRALARLALDSDAVIAAQLARRPARSPEWDRSTLKNHADVRKWIEELKRRLARWDDGDD